MTIFYKLATLMYVSSYMPELPEVETTLKGIKPWILGQQITGLIIRQASLRWPVT
jgi:formamidopyrimidine-DNA glycosylase